MTAFFETTPAARARLWYGSGVLPIGYARSSPAPAPQLSLETALAVLFGVAVTSVCTLLSVFIFLMLPALKARRGCKLLPFSGWPHRDRSERPRSLAYSLSSSLLPFPFRLMAQSSQAMEQAALDMQRTAAAAEKSSKEMELLSLTLGKAAPPAFDGIERASSQMEGLIRDVRGWGARCFPRSAPRSRSPALCPV